MKVRAQIGMVLNLDKCIGCHTCSVTCKNVWTSRPGVEYAWFNNVETKPGIGYPKEWENQDKWKGGWVRKADGRIVPRQGGKLKLLAGLFANPNLPEIDDYAPKGRSPLAAAEEWRAVACPSRAVSQDAARTSRDGAGPNRASSAAGASFTNCAAVSAWICVALPLTVTEWEEWGDPRSEPYASYMLSYSPYDNLQAKAYPAMLVTLTPGYFWYLSLHPEGTGRVRVVFGGGMAPEFVEALRREFPPLVGELTDDVARRSFLQLSAASLGLAGLGVGVVGRHLLAQLGDLGRRFDFVALDPAVDVLAVVVQARGQLVEDDGSNGLLAVGSAAAIGRLRLLLVVHAKKPSVSY